MLSRLAVYSTWASAPMPPLGVRGANTDLIQIRNIVGLDPVGGDINTAPFGSVDGETFVGAHVPKRNIVLTLGLNPDWKEWNTESLRRAIYAYFMPKQPVHMVFKSDDDLPDVWIDGYTESVETNLFYKDGEIQVSIICPDPYFTAVDPTVVHGNVGVVTSTPINYNGTIETGYTLKITQIGPPDLQFITVRRSAPPISIFQVWANVNASSYMMMSSIIGQKYVRNIQMNTGVITNRLDKVVDNSVWPVLTPGQNYVSVVAEVVANAAWELTYFEKFGGL